MSRLRARCPNCRTLTAVALGGSYECHSCGREFGAGLVRVPRAWGEGGEAMIEAAYLPLPYPEVGVVEEDTLSETNLALAPTRCGASWPSGKPREFDRMWWLGTATRGECRARPRMVPQGLGSAPSDTAARHPPDLSV